MKRKLISSFALSILFLAPQIHDANAETNSINLSLPSPTISVENQIKSLNNDLAELDSKIRDFDYKYTEEGQELNEEDSSILLEYKVKKEKVSYLYEQIGLSQNGLFSGKKDIVGSNSYISFSGTCTFNTLNPLSSYFSCSNVAQNKAGGKVYTSLHVKGYGLGFDKKAFVTVDSLYKSAIKNKITTVNFTANYSSPLTAWYKVEFYASDTAGLSVQKDLI